MLNVKKPKPFEDIKIGDRVRSSEFGLGVVFDVERVDDTFIGVPVQYDVIKVKFDNGNYCEYTLDGVVRFCNEKRTLFKV